MNDAKTAYENFKIEHSRELTDEEKLEDSRQFQPFVGITPSITRIFELTEENVDEMKRLEKNVHDTYKAFVNEYMKSKK